MLTAARLRRAVEVGGVQPQFMNWKAPSVIETEEDRIKAAVVELKALSDEMFERSQAILKNYGLSGFGMRGEFILTPLEGRK